MDSDTFSRDHLLHLGLSADTDFEQFSRSAAPSDAHMHQPAELSREICQAWQALRKLFGPNESVLASALVSMTQADAEALVRTALDSVQLGRNKTYRQDVNIHNIEWQMRGLKNELQSGTSLVLYATHLDAERLTIGPSKPLLDLLRLRISTHPLDWLYCDQAALSTLHWTTRRQHKNQSPSWVRLQPASPPAAYVITAWTDDGHSDENGPAQLSRTARWISEDMLRPLLLHQRFIYTLLLHCTRLAQSQVDLRHPTPSTAPKAILLPAAPPLHYNSSLVNHFRLAHSPDAVALERLVQMLQAEEDRLLGTLYAVRSDVHRFVEQAKKCEQQRKRHEGYWQRASAAANVRASQATRHPMCVWYSRKTQHLQLVSRLNMALGRVQQWLQCGTQPLRQEWDEMRSLQHELLCRVHQICIRLSSLHAVPLKSKLNCWCPACSADAASEERLNTLARQSSQHDHLHYAAAFLCKLCDKRYYHYVPAAAEFWLDRCFAAEHTGPSFLIDQCSLLVNCLQQLNLALFTPDCHRNRANDSAVHFPADDDSKLCQLMDALDRVWSQRHRKLFFRKSQDPCRDDAAEKLAQGLLSALMADWDLIMTDPARAWSSMITPTMKRELLDRPRHAINTSAGQQELRKRVRDRQMRQVQPWSSPFAQVAGNDASVKSTLNVVPRTKVKTRGVPAPIDSTALAVQQQERPQSALLANRIYRIDNNAMTTWETILFVKGKPRGHPGKMPWTAIVHALSSVGLILESTDGRGGSARNFLPHQRPDDPLPPLLPLTLHLPHSRTKMHFTWDQVKGVTAHVCARYGWTIDSFTTSDDNPEAWRAVV